MLQITLKTPPIKILEYIGRLREQKGKENEVLRVIKKALESGNDLVVNLYWEKALSYQHLVMNEDAKGENADRENRLQFLLKMEEAVKHAGYLIVRFGLERWKHRLYRFLGRVCDYKKEYRRAISYYKKSLKYSKIDPEYLELRYPRWLEVEGLLSTSLIMSGETGKGHTKAMETYNMFDKEKDAILLKKNDFATWAIWKSGIPIRTINALMDNKVGFDKKVVELWLNKTEEILRSSKNETFKNTFKYRLDEIASVKRRMKILSN